MPEDGLKSFTQNFTQWKKYNGLVVKFHMVLSKRLVYPLIFGILIKKDRTVPIVFVVDELLIIFFAITKLLRD